MRRVAVAIAVGGLFVLAGVGCLADVPVETCALRAGVGAVVLYVLARAAGDVLLKVCVDAMVRSRQEKEPARDPGNS